MTVKHAGRSFSDSGQLNVKASTTPVANAGNVKFAGVACDANGNRFNFDATSALPAGAFLHCGIAYTLDGRICTTTGTPAATGTKQGGIAIRADGAMHVTTNAVTSASVSTKNGAFVNALGALHIVAN